MRSVLGAIGPLLVATLLAAPPAARGDSALLEEAVGLSGLAMFMESGATGMVLAVVHGDDDLVVGFGETAKGSGQEPDGKIAGPARLDLEGAGRRAARRAGGRRAAWPDGSSADTTRRPALACRISTGGTITLLDLATHAAALPRELPVAPPAGAAPFAWPTAADRYDWLAAQKLPWAPGSAAAYSNVGFDLLGAALAEAAGKSYADLLRERITGPLGMVDTGVAPNEEQCARLMSGYGIPGAEAAPCVSTANIAGSGGVYSTADDMVLWLRHNLARADAAAWPTLALTHAAYVQRQDSAPRSASTRRVRWMPSPLPG